MRTISAEVIFSWTFFLFVGLSVILYFIWLSLRRPDKQEKGLLNLGLFKFHRRDVLAWLGITAITLIFVACVSFTAAIHAAAFSQATEKKCLLVEEIPDKYVFTATDACYQNALLWNRVEINKNEGQPVKDFLEQK